MTDPEDLENEVHEIATDLDLALAYIGEDLRELYNEGVRMRIEGEDEPAEWTNSLDRVRRRGWEAEDKRRTEGKS